MTVTKQNSGVSIPPVPLLLLRRHYSILSAMPLVLEGGTIRAFGDRWGEV